MEAKPGLQSVGCLPSAPRPPELIGDGSTDAPRGALSRLSRCKCPLRGAAEAEGAPLRSQPGFPLRLRVFGRIILSWIMLWVGRSRGMADRTPTGTAWIDANKGAAGTTFSSKGKPKCKPGFRFTGHVFNDHQSGF